MANTPKPKPTAMQIGMIVLGAVIGGLISGIFGLGGAIGGGIIGLGAALGGLPYFRSIGEWQKAQKP